MLNSTIIRVNILQAATQPAAFITQSSTIIVVNEECWDTLSAQKYLDHLTWESKLHRSIAIWQQVERRVFRSIEPVGAQNIRCQGAHGEFCLEFPNLKLWFVSLGLVCCSLHGQNESVHFVRCVAQQGHVVSRVYHGVKLHWEGRIDRELS